MLKTNAQLYTNVGKSQIEETDTHFKISGIPVTKNNKVMNEIAYLEQYNAEGIPTIEEQPITLRHPEVNGVNVSAKQGKGLMYFSGSLVGKHYLDNGTWKVDTLVNKKKLAAQDDGERWTEILSNKETFGVSTGLTFTRNSESGELDGVPYKMVAKGQNYDHLAFLDPKVESPAGGEDTMVRFNANVEQGEVIVCNIDNDEPLIIDKPKGPENQTINQSMFDKFLYWMASHGDFAPATDKGYNSQEFDVNQLKEDLIMDRSEMLEALGLATNSQVSDDELKTLMKSKLAANASEDFTATIESVDTSKAPEWAETLIKKVNSLEAQLAANADKELNSLIADVVALKINGIDEAVAKTMGVNALKGLLKANSAEFVAEGYNAQHSGRSSASNKKDEGFKDLDLNAGLEG